MRSTTLTAGVERCSPKRPSHAVAALITCLALWPTSVSAQSSYSTLVGIGIGGVPGDHRLPSVAGSVGVFRKVGPTIDFGLEVGYQRFGASPQQDAVGRCPILPVGACVGEVTADRHQRGHLWFVGPSARLRMARGGAVRPFLVAGLARYGSGEKTTVTYRDDRGVTVPAPEPLAFERRFGGLGVNGAVGIEGAGLGALRWALMVRAHGALGSMSGEMASVTGWTITAGLTLP